MNSPLHAPAPYPSSNPDPQHWLQPTFLINLDGVVEPLGSAVIAKYLRKKILLI